MVSNLDWTGQLSAIDFLRDIGKHFPVNQMLSREVVRARLETSGISYTEFSYQILQANDYLELHNRHDCTLQLGGSDQWGNLVSGVDLIRRVTEHTVHAMATPLITKPDGTKYGKTEGEAVWLSQDLMSSYAFYQFWLNRADAEVPGLLRVFSFRSREEIEELEREIAERPAARRAQRLLAEELTILVHGEAELARVQAASEALFGQGDLRVLDAPTLAAAVAEVPHADVEVSAADGDGELPGVADLMAATGIVPSKSAARRAIAEGGAYLNNEKVADRTPSRRRPICCTASTWSSGAGSAPSGLFVSAAADLSTPADLRATGFLTKDLSGRERGCAARSIAVLAGRWQPAICRTAPRHQWPMPIKDNNVSLLTTAQMRRYDGAAGPT